MEIWVVGGFWVVIILLLLLYCFKKSINPDFYVEYPHSISENTESQSKGGPLQRGPGVKQHVRMMQRHRLYWRSSQGYWPAVGGAREPEVSVPASQWWWWLGGGLCKHLLGSPERHRAAVTTGFLQRLGSGRPRPSDLPLLPAG